MQQQGYDSSAIQALVPRLQLLLQAFRNAGFPIYHTREGHRPDLSTLWPREGYRSRNNDSGLGIGDAGGLGRFLVRGETGHDIVPELYPLKNEPVVDKPGKGAFTYTDFELLLRVRGIKNLVVAGVTTEVCVSSTIREASDRGFDCLLVSDGTAASSPSLQSYSVETVKVEGGIFGSTANLEDILEKLNTLSDSKSSTEPLPNEATKTQSGQPNDSATMKAPAQTLETVRSSQSRQNVPDVATAALTPGQPGPADAATKGLTISELATEEQPDSITRTAPL